MTEVSEDVITDLSASARDAHTRAALDLLIEQNHWLWDEGFVAASVHVQGTTTYISWNDALAYLETGASYCSGGEETILRIAIDLGSGRWMLDRLDVRNRRRVADAVAKALRLERRP